MHCKKNKLVKAIFNEILLRWKEVELIAYGSFFFFFFFLFASLLKLVCAFIYPLLTGLNSVFKAFFINYTRAFIMLLVFFRAFSSLQGKKHVSIAVNQMTLHYFPWLMIRSTMLFNPISVGWFFLPWCGHFCMFAIHFVRACKKSSSNALFSHLKSR